MLSNIIRFVKSAVTCESGREVLSRISLYFGIGKHILYFHIVFMSHALLSTDYFQTARSVFGFFVIDRTQKQTLLDMQQISFAVVKLNVQFATAENEKQYILSKCIKFQNFFFFSFRSHSRRCH